MQCYIATEKNTYQEDIMRERDRLTERDRQRQTYKGNGHIMRKEMNGRYRDRDRQEQGKLDRDRVKL